MTDWVQVRVAGEHYAIDVAEIREVALRGDVRSVPGAPSAVLGVHNLRGQVIVVIDLAVVLGIAAGKRSAPAYLVVAEAGGERAALAIDEVLAVGALDGDAEVVAEGSVRGRLLIDGVLFGVLDVGRLLNSVVRMTG